MISRESFKNSIKDDVDSYGKPRKLMTKLNSLFDSFEAELKAKDEEIAKYKHMKEWIEENSNSGLCDYYNSLENE